MRTQHPFTTLLLTLLVLGGFGAVIWANSRSTADGRTIIPTLALATDDPNAWQAILAEGFGSNSTPLPTMGVPQATFAPPTLLPLSGDTNLLPIGPQQVSNSNALPTENPVTTPTLPAATIAVTERFVTRPPADWQPPALEPPISRDPLGRDHFWFSRPVDSNAVNYELSSYAYGSDGPQQETPWRVHHGIDMPNPIGQTVRAAGDGKVIWAGPNFQDTFSYGNVVFIQHDFGYRGKALYTLYAHLSAILVSAGQVVNAGDPIGLVGNTGRVSGPHVHFEIRMSGDGYRDTYNPSLWMVPYVGYGVVAGRVTNASGRLLQDLTVTLRDRKNGLVVQSITTYIQQETGSDVNADPLWQENFVFADVPVGRYEVVALVDGVRVSQVVDVLEGMTSFAELLPQAVVEATVTP